MILFYSNHCPRCKGIQAILDSKGISYEQITDIEEILQAAEKFGEASMPFAVIDGIFYNTKDFQKWVIAQEAK